MPLAFLPDTRLHYRLDGPGDGPALVLVHDLGGDLAMWDGLLPLLPAGLRVLRPDLRGHGGSDVPEAPYAMGALVRDAERLMDQLDLREAAVVGAGLGGMVALALAVKRFDLVRGLVLTGTAARLGTEAQWAERIAQVRAGGMAAIYGGLATRMFARAFRGSPAFEPWRAMILATPPEGYAGCAAAVSGTDLYAPTAGLRLPALAIAGSEDGITPPDLVRETGALIPGSRFALIRGAGHWPFAERPGAFAEALAGFLTGIGHGPPG